MTAMLQRLLLVAALLGAMISGLQAEGTLRIGISEKPPYAEKTVDGEWVGIGVALWRNIALLTGEKFEWVEMPAREVLGAVRDGRVDAAVGEIEVTADYERAVDFTQPYLESSVGVAVSDRLHRVDWFALYHDFFNWQLVGVLAAIFVGLLLVSVLIWICEKSHEVGHFKGGLGGFGSALWFSAVTMTTVGYGDKTPVTFRGRFISFIWMFAGVLLIASFTAAVASSAATARISRTITSVADLARIQCGVVEGSLPQTVLRQQGIEARAFESIEEAVDALGRGGIEALVADRVTLAYFARENSTSQQPYRFRLSPLILQKAYVAIPVHPGLPQFEEINVALLETTASRQWQDVLNIWLGHPAAGSH